MYNFSIIGGTSVLGRATATLLSRHQYKTKALVRDRNKASDLQEKGITLITGDCKDPACLEEICRDTEVVITAFHSMLGKGANRSELIDEKAHINLIDTSVKEGVQHFIYISASGASPDHPIDFWRTKFRVEQHLKSSGLTYTIFRPAAFMEWHMHNLLGKALVTKGKTMIMGKGDNPTNFLAAVDLAKTILLAYKNESFYNQVFEIGGPDNLSRKEVVSLYARHLHITPKVSHLPLGLVKTLSSAFKPFHPGVSRIMKVAALGDVAPSTMGKELTVERFGIKPTTAEEFVQQVLATDGI